MIKVTVTDDGGNEIILKEFGDESAGDSFTISLSKDIRLFVESIVEPQKKEKK